MKSLGRLVRPFAHLLPGWLPAETLAWIEPGSRRWLRLRMPPCPLSALSSAYPPEPWWTIRGLIGQAGAIVGFGQSEPRPSWISSHN
jgi:hypothetical protein